MSPLSLLKTGAIYNRKSPCLIFSQASLLRPFFEATEEENILGPWSPRTEIRRSKARVQADEIYDFKVPHRMIDSHLHGYVGPA